MGYEDTGRSWKPGAFLVLVFAFLVGGYVAAVTLIDPSAEVLVQEPAPVFVRPDLEFQKIAESWADTHSYSLGEKSIISTYDQDGSVNGSQNVTTGRYACDNFSKDLSNALEEKGYNAEYCVGDALWCKPWEEEDKSCKHAWVKVEIYIEATTGEILNSSDYRRNYVEEKCGRK